MLELARRRTGAPLLARHFIPPHRDGRGGGQVIHRRHVVPALLALVCGEKRSRPRQARVSVLLLQSLAKRLASGTAVSKVGHVLPLAPTRR
eukprot:5248447-Prymnesium_polylepis.1